jgi:acetyl-CoA carboxylase biotin carboxyl carrier protein
MDLTNDDVLTILKIIDESECEDVRLEIGDFKLHVQKHPRAGYASKTSADNQDTPRTTAPEPFRAISAVTPQASSAVSKMADEEQTPDGLVAVRAPMLGTFYRAPSPGERPFVEVGNKVSPNDTVCLVEVMKLFNSIKAGVAGTIVKIQVENGTMVEYGQILLLIEHDLIHASGSAQ